MPEYQSRLELLARVASLYYDKEKNQQEIADEIGLTRSAVSRLLTEAHKRGIVEHIIHYPWRTSIELENALAETFKLKNVQVLIRQNKTYEEMLQGLGVLAAEYFTSLLPNLNIVGITWGTGLYQMVRAFRPHNRPDMEVVQLIGGTGTERGSSIGPLLAPNLANCLGCTCRFLHAPLLMQNQVAHVALMQDRSIRETLERAAMCDIALVGIGSTLPELSNAHKLGYLSLEEIQQMQAEGIVGDVAGLHYNREGKILLDHWINQRMVVISASTLSKIKEVMGVAGGYKKGESIYAALRGEHIHTLITDEEAARRVLELHKQEQKSNNQP
jgi:DNA-binding transcriptional regulator LsrR (DeoR family)